MKAFLLHALTTVLLGLGFWLIAWWTLGSSTAALAYLQGYPVCAEPASVTVDVRSGEAYTAEFNLRNLCARPVTIIGAQCCCGCYVLTDLPATLPPGETSRLHVVVMGQEPFHGRDAAWHAVLLLDVPGPRPVLTVQSSGRASKIANAP